MANVIIDIEIVIDTQSVLNTYGRTPGTWDHPTGIAHSYGYMVAQSDYVRSGQATGDLAIKAIEGDAIRWRSLSLSGNANESAVIYAITKINYTYEIPLLTIITLRGVARPCRMIRQPSFAGY